MNLGIVKKCSRPKCINRASIQPVFKVPLMVGGVDITQVSRRLAPLTLIAPPVCRYHASARPRDYAEEEYWSDLVRRVASQNLNALWDQISVEFHPLRLEQQLKDRMTIHGFEDLKKENIG